MIDAQSLGQQSREIDHKVAEQPGIGLINGLKKRGIALKKRSLRVRVPQCPPMGCLPWLILADLNLIDGSGMQLPVLARGHGNRQPFCSVGGLDSISVSPAVLVEIDIVVKD